MTAARPPVPDPVIVMGYNPIGTSFATETETAELEDPPAEGVTVTGEKLTLTPEGCPLADRVTADEKPLIEVIVTVADAELPVEVLTLWGETAIPKSPEIGGAVTCREKS